MAHWVYFLHTSRENFAATMTDAEREVWGRHLDFLKRLMDDGSLILAGPTLGRINTGISIFEAPDETAAQSIMEADPTIAEGFATGELREFRLAFLRGRD